MQELLVFLFGPFGLLDGWIQPLVPSCFALLRRLPCEEGGDLGPLLEDGRKVSGSEGKEARA